MARTWLTVRVELIGGRGEDLWPRPGRVLAARPGHTFRQLAEAINDAFARWDRSHLHEFTLADGTRVVPLEWFDDADEDELDDAREKLSRLELGEQFAFVFDLGDHWEHLCTVGDEKVDVVEVAGITPAEPLPIDGWGSIPDQYGRRWDADDGDGPPPPPPEPPASDLPPLLQGWGDEPHGRPAVPHGSPQALGSWRPLTWTEASHRDLRGAVARGDTDTVLELMAGRDPLEVAHLAAPGILAALLQEATTAREYAELLRRELTARQWDGDQELADELIAADSGRPTALTEVAVDLDELAMRLRDASAEAEPWRLHLPTGRWWPHDLALIGEPAPADWEDESRWLDVRFLGSRAGWRDMRDFTTTIEDDVLADKLDVAISGKGAFRRFGDVLRPHEQEWTRWSRFSEERELGRARAFLAAEGLRPAITPDRDTSTP